MIKPLSLRELNEIVSEVISLQMDRSYWLQAELSQVSENRGHCYLEFIEKSHSSDEIIARAFGRCWANVWGMLKPYFERVTGQIIRPGIKVMVQVTPQFHPLYGFSWIVEDINPEFTMGDMQRKRNEIIEALKAQGVFDLQKELYLPQNCSRIAIISSSTAAGYGDFCNQLESNEFGLAFTIELFESSMQGMRVEADIIRALDAINKREKDFDCVVIIRGGGATADLSCFDSLKLAENIANFPLPIITGIGHERDESVLDLISFQRVKTPTAAAAFLIDWQNRQLSLVLYAEEQLYKLAKDRLIDEKNRLQSLTIKVPLLFSLVRIKQENYLDSLLGRLAEKMKAKIKNSLNVLNQYEKAMPHLIERQLTGEYHRIELLENRLKFLDPDLLLKRGYSITYLGNEIVKDSKKLRKGDTLVTKLSSGTVESIVK